MKISDVIDLVRRLQTAYPSVFLDLLDAIVAYRDISQRLWTTAGLRQRIAAAIEILSHGSRLTPSDVDDLISAKANSLLLAGGKDLLFDAFCRMAGFDPATECLVSKPSLPVDWSEFSEPLAALAALPGVVPADVQTICCGAARVMQEFESDDRLQAIIERV